MDKEIVESIKMFENKKEFREVKLKTRQSFREDQAALERRLSKHRIKPTSKHDMSNGIINGQTEKVHKENGHVEKGHVIKGNSENGHVEKGRVKNGHVEKRHMEKGHVNKGYMENGHAEKVLAGETDESVLSKLESIVLDIGEEKQKERTQSTDEVVVIDTEEKQTRKNSLDDNIVLGEGVDNGLTNTDTEGDKTSVQINAKTHTLKVPQQNGHVIHHVNQKGHGSRLTNGSVTNGHSASHTGQTSGPSTLLIRPKVSGHARAAMTPEPRLKSTKGIYQKNPKLTPGSTEHLDNVSLKGFKHSAQHHGQRVEYTTVPSVPGAEVTSIPADGNLSEFNVEQMVTVFRLLKLPEELLSSFYRCKVDGKRFAVFSDSELRDFGINNPIIRYFRDKTAKRHKKKTHKFML